LHRYNGRCEFFTWLCAILLNRHRNSFRNSRSMAVSNLGSGEQDEFANAVDKRTDSASAPDEAAQIREQAALVRKCIETLPVKHQQVIFLRFYVYYALEVIAVALGCSVGTVKSRLFHALDKLRGMNALNAQFMNLKTKG